MQTRNASLFLSALFLGVCVAAQAQAPDKAAIQQKLASKYVLTKTTADRTDIVTAGAVLTLKKDNLIMVDVSSSNLYQNTYKDGKISQNALGKISRFRLPGVPGVPVAAQSGGSERTFVAGEKMWITHIDVKDTGVNLELYSDEMNGVRYRAVLSVPFKGTDPIDVQSDKLVAEVFDAQPPDNGGGQGQAPASSGPSGSAQPPPAAPQQAEAPPPPIPPPPPPTDAAPVAPKTLSLGQTKDEVVANFGQPEKIANVGAKQIYYYKDFKVTFVNGKVSDVQ